MTLVDVGRGPCCTKDACVRLAAWYIVGRSEGPCPGAAVSLRESRSGTELRRVVDSRSFETLACSWIPADSWVQIRLLWLDVCWLLHNVCLCDLSATSSHRVLTPRPLRLWCDLRFRGLRLWLMEEGWGRGFARRCLGVVNWCEGVAFAVAEGEFD